MCTSHRLNEHVHSSPGVAMVMLSQLAFLSLFLSQQCLRHPPMAKSSKKKREEEEVIFPLL